MSWQPCCVYQSSASVSMYVVGSRHYLLEIGHAPAVGGVREGQPAGALPGEKRHLTSFFVRRLHCEPATQRRKLYLSTQRSFLPRRCLFSVCLERVVQPRFQTGLRLRARGYCTTSPEPVVTVCRHADGVHSFHPLSCLTKSLLLSCSSFVMCLCP